MPTELVTLFGVTLVLAGLIGVLVLALLRLRRAARDGVGVASMRLSEEAFMASAIKEVTAARASALAPTAVEAPVLSEEDVLRALGVAVLALDDQGRLTMANPSASALLGLPHAFRAAPVSEMLAGPAALLASIEEALRGRRAVRRRIVTVTPTREGAGPRRIALTASPVRAKSASGMVFLLDDVTEDAAEEHRAHEKAVMREAAALASGLTHELANSLTAVHGYSRLIDPRTLPELDRSSLEAVHEETATLVSVLEGFRRLVRLPDPTLSPVDLASLVDEATRDVVEDAHVAAEAVEYSGPRPFVLPLDREQLGEAVASVLRNAIEACAQASIEPRVRIDASRGDASGPARLTISDNGPGVPEEDRRRLFRPFFSTKGRHPGLGLAFVRRVVVGHGGEIAITHPPTGGMTVTLTLPLAESARRDC